MGGRHALESWVQQQIENATDGLPLGELDYAEITANQSGIGTTETDITGLEITADLVDGRIYRVTSYVRGWNASAAEVLAEHQLYDQTIGTLRQYRRVAIPFSGGSNQNGGLLAFRFVASSSGSREFRARARSVTSGETVDVTASSGAPAFIMIEDLGVA